MKFIQVLIPGISTIANNRLIRWKGVHYINVFCLFVVVDMRLIIQTLSERFAEMVGIVLMPEITQEILTSMRCFLGQRMSDSLMGQSCTKFFHDGHWLRVMRRHGRLSGFVSKTSILWLSVNSRSVSTRQAMIYNINRTFYSFLRSNIIPFFRSIESSTISVVYSLIGTCKRNWLLIFMTSEVHSWFSFYIKFRHWFSRIIMSLWSSALRFQSKNSLSSRTLILNICFMSL